METTHRKHKIIAFIPLRHGSKSIPLKNIKKIAGKPLAHWVIEAALNCSLIDKVIISTDSERIKNKVQELEDKRLEIIGRTEKTATDTAMTEDAMIEFAESNAFGYIVLIQATSPLTESFHLEQAIEKFFRSKLDSLVSVVRQKRFIWEEKDGEVRSVNYELQNRPRSQDFKGFLVENGAIYITSRDRLLSTKCRVSGKISLYEMPYESYFELDGPIDWFIVENVLKQKEKDIPFGLNEKMRKIKLFAMDIDGVLTDGGMYYSEQKEVFKKFNTRDGMGINLLIRSGITPAFVTKEDSIIAIRRAEKLNVQDVYTGVQNKLEVIEELAAKYNITFNQIAYIGDDINDIPVLEKTGLSFAPSDAVDKVRSEVDYVLEKRGGSGAVREAIDLILKYRSLDSSHAFKEI